MLFLGFFVGFLGFLGVVPKRYAPGKGWTHPLVSPTRRQYTVLWISVLAFAALFYFGGAAMVSLALMHGVVITMFA